MSNIGSAQEGGIRVKLLNLTVNEEIGSIDNSFDSSPESSFNRGALAFIELVENALEKASCVGFDQLVVEMMDLGMGERVPTSAQIPALLNEKGWSVQQVSQVWSVAPTTTYSKEWDVNTLKKLGGSCVISSVWQALKDRNQAGHYKR